MLQNLPLELRLLPQWVCSNEDKIPYHPSGYRADVTNPSSWATFEQACSAGYKYVGFVLSENDPYCIIDLDDKIDSPLTEHQQEVHKRILEAFESYTERSASGRGYHIIIKADLQKGRRKDNVEVYSKERYMICTGDLVRPTSIKDYQSLVIKLTAEMTTTAEPTQLVQVDSDIPDARVVEKASAATNGEKFDKLCNGDWQNDYTSQSEADFALMSIFCFYSKDNEQCRRLFRYTKLGKRDKAKRDSYLNYAISKIRGNETPNVDLAALSLQAARILEDETKELPEVDNTIPEEDNYGIVEPLKSVPPGLVGMMTDYFYNTSIRPVYEIALATALALMAGVIGRAYNINGAGLNHYIILLARTGSGKEGAAQGIEKLVNSCRPQIPSVDGFVGPAVFSSGQALIKVLSEKPCFVSVLGEFGLTLQQISDPRASSSEKTLKKVLLDLYMKAGKKDVLRSSVYSDSEKNTKSVQSPSVTILGESTPETFFEGLDSSNIAEGLIPRFNIIEYHGRRPPLNEACGIDPSAELTQRFSNIVAQSLTLQSKTAVVDVKMDNEATDLMRAFCKHADNVMNTNLTEVETQLWNRAHLKALKIAALLAVGCNHIEPIVNAEIAKWALDFVYLDIETITKRFFVGDIGAGDSKKLADLKRVVLNYKKDNVAITTYKVPKEMQKDYIIPLNYLSRKLLAMASFRKDRLGASRALSETVRHMVEQSTLIEIPQAQIFEKYGVKWKCYTLGDLF